MKICTNCKELKHLKDFNKNKSKKDGLSNICRVCSNEVSKEYYAKNLVLHKNNVAIRKVKLLAQNKSLFINLLKSSECKDCGNKDIRVLEFDHLFDKHRNVSDLLGTGYSWKRIEEEIKKCEIVCCNCHRIRTTMRDKKNYRRDLI